MFCVSCGFALPPDSATEEAASPVTGGRALSEVDGPPPAQPGAVAARPAESNARHSLAQLAALVVGVSLGVAAVAIAITLALVPPGPATGGPAGTVGDLQVVEVANIRAEVPGAWTVVRRAGDTIAVHDQARRALWLRSALLPTAVSLDAIQEQSFKRARDGSPDAKICAGPDGAPVPGGPAEGRYYVICYTFIPQGGGPAVALADAFYVATGGASAIFMMQLTAVPEALEAFAGAVRQLPAPVWKLQGG